MTTTIRPELLDELLTGYEKPDDLAPGTLNSILKQAGLKERH
jgi:hypothetical protein